MYVLEGSQLQGRIQKINAALNTNERFFVDYVCHYLEGTNDKILAIGGLRGTGKTTGTRQKQKFKNRIQSFPKNWKNFFNIDLKTVSLCKFVIDMVAGKHDMSCVFANVWRGVLNSYKNRKDVRW